jgi:hypothetical protein
MPSPFALAPKPNVFRRFTRKVSQALGKAKLKRAQKRIAKQMRQAEMQRQILSAKSAEVAIREEQKAARKAVQAATVPVATPKVVQVAKVPVATPKVVQVATVPVAAPKAAQVVTTPKVAAPKAAQVATTPKVAPVTRSGSARNGAAIVQVTKVPEYEGDYRLMTDPLRKELEIARIDRVIAHNKRAGIHDFYPDVLARMQERNMKIPDTPERIRKLHGWYLKPSELTPKAAPTTMLHHDLGETLAGGSKKRTSKHKNKNKNRTKHNIKSKTQRK